MSFFSRLFGISPPVPPAACSVPSPVAPTAAAVPSSGIPGLAAALSAAAPHADHGVWIQALTEPMSAAGIVTPRRIAAFLGQCAVEAGPALAELSEVTCYTTAARLVMVFPDEFPTVASTSGYVGQAEKIACHVYANRMGNGDEASGDGWTMRGAGLLQLTGRDEIGAYGATVGLTADQAAATLWTPAGAAAGACWYWTTNRLNALADAWSVTAVTRAINGAGMEAAAARLAASNAALTAMGAA